MALGNAGGPDTTGIEARHDGECAECFDEILVGERITKVPGGWAHVTCPDQRDYRAAAPLRVDRWDGTDPNEMGY